MSRAACFADLGSKSAGDLLAPDQGFLHGTLEAGTLVSLSDPEGRDDLYEIMAANDAFVILQPKRHHPAGHLYPPISLALDAARASGPDLFWNRVSPLQSR